MTNINRNLFILIAMAIAWYIPVVNQYIFKIDKHIFITLNLSLKNSPFLQYLIGYLNHPNENWINLIVMVTINFLLILLQKNNQYKKQVFSQVLLFWLFFQLPLIINHLIFNKLLDIARVSPSLVIPAKIKLANILHINGLKESSRNSFPAGHAFVAIYWMSFTLLHSKKLNPNIFNKYNLLILVTGLFIIMPRLFTGAHWATDLIFTIPLTLLWFTFAKLLIIPAQPR